MSMRYGFPNYNDCPLWEARPRDDAFACIATRNAIADALFIDLRHTTR